MKDTDLKELAAHADDTRLLEATEALKTGQLPVAESVLRSVLKDRPADVAAMCLMAEVSTRLDRLVDSEQLLRRAIDLDPTFSLARASLADVLTKQKRPAEARKELNRLTAMSAVSAAQDGLKAEAAGRLGAHEEAIELYLRVLEQHPRDLAAWVSLGHNLRTVGRSEEAAAAYRHACEPAPQFGEAWWGLANLKSYSFTDADLAAMKTALASGRLRPEDRVHLQFALGKALEDRGEWQQSFGHYAAANRERRAALRYRASDFRQLVDRSIATFSPSFFADRPDYGNEAPDPIFIVGLPRSGSTLVEQILSSHPLVEGTAEHNESPMLAKRLAVPDGHRETRAYPELLADLDRDSCSALGEEYLDRLSAKRVTDKPFFIDKLPNNWMHLGFIRLILPNAKIVDARRHPLACGFSNFKQHFARGQNYTYDLFEMGDLYAQYVRLMRHFDAVLPNPPVRIINEALIDDPEGEIRKLVAALGLPWDDACLRHHENERAVRTPSAEQVRRPVNADGVDQWRHYEEWLGPLRTALGPTLEDWKR